MDLLLGVPCLFQYPQHPATLNEASVASQSPKRVYAQCLAKTSVRLEKRRAFLNQKSEKWDLVSGFDGCTKWIKKSPSPLVDKQKTPLEDDIAPGHIIRLHVKFVR